jgi:predicted glycoside hydrolase/deacetylase ChbG (UPF0249 family)
MVADRSEASATAWPRPLLIADDFGLNAGCDRAISELAGMDRLSGTSAMVNFDSWAETAAALRQLRPRIAIGLHVNLTEGVPLTAPRPDDGEPAQFQSMTALVLRAFAKRLHQPSVVAEIAAQIERFCQDVGAMPDFIDGHQHVHVLPLVRDAFFEALTETRVPRHTLLRSPFDRWSRIKQRGLAAAKSGFIARLSARFAKNAEQAGFVTNDSFSGVTTLDEKADVRTELERALSHPGQRHLVMCHPGRDCPDLLSARRQAEYAALSDWDDIPDLIWRPEREASGIIDWTSPARTPRSTSESAAANAG